MNFKKYHVSKNLWDEQYLDGYYSYLDTLVPTDNQICTKNKIPVKPNTVYWLGVNFSQSGFMAILKYDNTGTFIERIITSSYTGQGMLYTTDSNTYFIKINFSVTYGTTYNNDIMIAESQTVLPYEPYSSEVWHDIPHYIHNTSTDTITTLPADVYADGNNATVGLVGNMSQTGTPTPSSPIQPSECGDRTGNLFDGSIESGGWSGSDGHVPTKMENGTRLRINNIFHIDPEKEYTVTVFPTTLQIAVMTLDDENKRIVDTGWSESNYQNISNAYGVVVTIRKSNNTGIIVNDCEGIMISEGSIAPSTYIPYGYKIPISSANTTTPVYLGEVQTTRRIKKLVLTGDEAFNTTTGGFYLADLPVNYLRAQGQNLAICSHYPTYEQVQTMSGVPEGYVSFSYDTLPRLYFKTSDYSTLTDFKTYLQQQYAAGTPVTVWFVLAEPTTGIVNEPLRKIGDYADTVSGITIPTITGKDSFDILTTLKPSEVDLTYHGWHDATVKEWDGSEWQ